VDTVPSGAAALDHLARDVEVLVVDDGMPDYPPGELATVAREREHSFRAVLVAPPARCEDPVPMGFDLHLHPPVDADALVEAVETAFACRTYDRAIRAFYRTATTRAEGESISRERIEECRAAADAALAAVDTATRESLLANRPPALDADT
jgi:DNA-binding NarL/FixJ family response regulator